jgi:tetratricopeptide (TPR) repeat protein
MAETLHRTAEADHLEGIALYKQGRFAEALACYEQALALQPAFPAALNSKGFVLQDMDRMEEALACFEQAVRLAPDFAMARLNLGLAQLKTGDWLPGWDNYEVRWTGSAESSNGSLSRPACPLPQWNGESETAAQRLLVFTEQGFGDTFQFSRYLTMATERFAAVGFVCSAPTLRLMEWSFAEKVVLFTRMPSDFTDWDWQCPLLSLPRAFRTRPETVPASVPYLKVATAAAKHWRQRLATAAPDRFRVGIAWAGRPAHQYDARRSLHFDQLLPLFDDPRVTWVSLQKWAPEAGPPGVPEDVDWLDWTEELTDFADTAALIDNLDLVISIDSAMAHLAGGLNRPVWMLNRFDSEWRWQRGRDDSPWYPAMRIFNQPAFGDWPSVIGAVRDSLQNLAGLPAGQRKRRRRPANAPAAPVAATATAVLNVTQAMALAGQYQGMGRLQEAESLLTQVLQRQPGDAQALHLLGVVAHQAGQPVRAIQLIERALAIEPESPLFSSNLAEMFRQQGRLVEAIRFGLRATGQAPGMPSAHSNLGIAYYDAKEYDKAEACHRQALALAGNLLQSLNNMGSIQRARKDLPGAAEWYRRALAVNPDYLESLSNLGAVLVEDHHAEDAVPLLEHALRLQPNYPEALCNLGLARLAQDRIDEAVALLERSLQLKPSYVEALLGLARARHEQDQLTESEALLRQVIAAAPENVDAWCQLGVVCMEQGETEAAEKAFAEALRIDPEAVDALAGLSNLRLEAGQIDAAEALLQQGLAIKPDHLGARFHLAQTRKVKPGDANLAALEAMLPEVDTLDSDKQISLHYALGKAYDDLGEYERGFPHFISGARLKRSKLHYDADADAARMARIAQVVDRAFVELLRGGGEPSDVPVFVLGMPRSGTTLTEQIIASHPDVFGAGELRDLMEVAQTQTVVGVLQPYPENLSGLTPAITAEWGRDYVERLRRRAPPARRITDKMPAQYLTLGLIPLLLPNARIIHVRRNPVDTCLSCFTRLFNRHQDATYDLTELGRHYRNYALLMDHWRALLPAGSFLEVQYEDIVADMETQARRLIDFCGLEWNDACLAFHKTKRNIRTASVTQVRQPIYSSSVERWRNYERFLGPLLTALGDLAVTQ